MSTTLDGFPVISVLIFGAVILFLQALYLLWRARRGASALRLQRRLDHVSRALAADGQRSLLKQSRLSELSSFARFLGGMSFSGGLERYLAPAGLGWTVARLLLTSGIAAALGCAVLAFSAWPLVPGIAVVILPGLLPWAYVARARSKRLRKLQSQLPDALDLITRALRAGHALPLGIQLLSEEMPDPIASEFRMVHDQVSFGISLQQALINLCDRVPLTDYRYFTVSVLIQRQSGGNLTEVLGKLSALVRERLKLQARVKVLSAEGRMSGWTLALLPFCLGGLMYAINPTFMQPLWTDPIGISILKTLLSMMLFGLFVLTRIVKIRV
jgi:tight adherence protein B